MLQHILIPLDGTPNSDRVLDRLMPLLKRPDTEIVLLHVSGSALAATLKLTEASAAQSDATMWMKQVAGTLADKGVRCQAVVRQGSPDKVILEAASAKTNGMIAMVSHGRAGLERAAFGSVAEQVLRHADAPMLLLHTGEDFSPVSFSRIVVPVDGSAAALAIAPFVTEIARVFKSSITLVHVLPEKPATNANVMYSKRVLQEAKEHFAHAHRILDVARERFADDALPCETLTRSGDAAEEIAALAAEKSAGLIACTTHGRTGIIRAVMGSVAEKLHRTTAVPMLIVRSPGK